MEIQLELEKLSNKFDVMSQKVDKMYQLMIGHELDEDSGYVSKIKNLEKIVDELVEFKKRIIWIGIGMSIPSGVGVWQIIQYFIGLK
jgi:UDP-N-acetyl-D-mannosaminuronic acid transferase (WecB/TagA/CpsF family)